MGREDKSSKASSKDSVKETEDLTTKFSRKSETTTTSLLPDWQPVNPSPPPPPVVTVVQQSPAPRELRPLTRDAILSNRLSLDDIKALPRFKSYSEGVPSQVRVVCEEHLFLFRG